MATAQLVSIKEEVISDHEDEQYELANINDEVVSEREEEQSELGNVNDEVLSNHEEEQSELANFNDEVVSEYEEEQSELANINDEVVSEHEEEQSEFANINDEAVSEHEEEQSEPFNINDEVVSEHEEEHSELANINDEVVSDIEEEQSELTNINDEVVSEHKEEQSELVNIKEEIVSDIEEEQSELANINDEVVSEHEEEQSELANINDEVVSEHEEEQSELANINDEVASEHEEEQSELVTIKEEVVSEQEEEQSVVKSSDALTATPAVTFPLVREAKPVLHREEYLTAWENEKDVQLQKFKKLAYEVVALKIVLPNAEAKLESAVNSVPVRLEFNTDSIVLYNKPTFLCSVFVDKVYVALGRGLTFEEAKTNACDFALQKIFMPYIRIVKIDPERSELEGSWNPFLSPPPEPSQAPVPKSAAKLPASAAMKSGCLKRRLDEQKPLQNFVVVEPIAPDCNPVIALRRSADFNDMLLEYESYFVGDGVRCAVKIEDCVLADVKGSTLESAMKLAASMALQKLKDKCWVIKIKDSDNKNSKKDMLGELSYQANKVKCKDNDGNSLFLKMSMYGGGVGKLGLEIMETVSPKNILSRDSFGPRSQTIITNAYENQVRQVLENYAASGNQEDLVFSGTFAYRERQVIVRECHRLNLIDSFLYQDKQNYLCVSRKRTVRELFDHIQANGGETARYVLVPPGVKNDSGHENVKGSKKNAGNGLLAADFLPRDKLIPLQSMAIGCLGAAVFIQVAKLLQGNLVRPFIGNGFSCPRPGSFNTPAPDILGNILRSPCGMANIFHGPFAFRQLAPPLQGNPMISGNRFGFPIPGGFNEMNRFHNGGMGPPGFRNDQNLYNQWGIQNNRGYFSEFQ